MSISLASCGIRIILLRQQFRTVKSEFSPTGVGSSCRRLKMSSLKMMMTMMMNDDDDDDDSDDDHDGDEDDDGDDSDDVSDSETK